MKLISQNFWAFLVDPRGLSPRELSLQDNGISVVGKSHSLIGFGDVAAKPFARRGLLFSSLALNLGNGAQVILPAAKLAAAIDFADAAESAWSKFNLEQLAKEEKAIRDLLHALGGLKAPEHYPSACHVDPLARQAGVLRFADGRAPSLRVRDIEASFTEADALNAADGLGDAAGSSTGSNAQEAPFANSTFWHDQPSFYAVVPRSGADVRRRCMIH
ncbi:hypothetical protein P775_28685 [Puniceibacterium antarcticum]|uniref:Uncharacterized protein n=1 Tax=Puniceibacterium antarcticum TaxID=1206336 RepID=A0A2G8QR06_9RHOB|nr:hypothetical protein [Puniceibacterium antarcticum]PIL11717.1 hypothetical protein P775_28685 [Puniceibacterium antarcticum]